MRIGKITSLAIVAVLLQGCITGKGASVADSGKTDRTPLNILQSAQNANPAPGEATPQQLKKHGNLLHHLAENMDWKSYRDRKDVQTMIKFYARKPEYLERSLKRGGRYLYHIVGELERHDMPLELALLPMVESAYQPYAQSPKLAAGLWQFIPATGKRYGLNSDYWHDQRYDPVNATRGALHYLRDLAKMHGKYEDKWFLSLASYNWGENRVKRQLRKNKAAGKKMDYWSIRKPNETRNYVPSLLAMVEIVKNPGKYKVKLPAIANTPYFEAVRLSRPIDLGLAARLADISMEELYALNGGLKRWLRPPQAPARLLVPVAKAPLLRQKLSELDDGDWIKSKQHKVAKGETLVIIAAKYGIDSNLLKGINPYLRSRNPRAGEVLEIPQPKFNQAHYAARKAGDRIYPATGERIVHKVRSGESLWLIAKKYGTTVKRIKQWNNRSSNLLRPGQKLVVWAGGKSGGSNAGKLSANGIYTVRRGDTLSRIAQKFRVKMSSIVKLNNLRSAHKLSVGQKLRINGSPQIAQANSKKANDSNINYTVKRGDSLWSIAKRYNVSVKTLLAWNSMNKPPRHLQPGQLLRILGAQ